MINAQSLNAAVTDEPEDDLMNRAEHFRQLDSDRRKVIDVEEAPVIDLVRRNAPERQAVRLIVEETFEVVEAGRRARRPVDVRKDLFHGVTHLGTAADQLAQSPFRDFLLPLTFLKPFRALLITRRQILELVDDALELHARFGADGQDL